MGQLFDRASRVIRAELNSKQGDCDENHLNEGTALVTGGAAIGASIGKVGILAGGTGYSIGTAPLAAIGALTGAALYEALRSLIEGDTSSANAAAIGATTGAVTSAAIGGLGVAAGGSAAGVGMASMAAGGAVVGLGLVGLHHLIQQGIDPEKLLDVAIDQMEADLQNARRALIDVVANQKRLQQRYKQAQAEVDKWKQRTQLAKQKGDAFLVQEAWKQQKVHTEVLEYYQAQIGQEPDSVKNLALLETKISEAKTMRAKLKVQVAATRASSAMGAFERMEDKILQMEARSQAAAELAGADLESQLAMLEAGGDVDDELAAMKAQIMVSAPQNQAQSKEYAVDPELEALKAKLDQL